MANYRSGFNLPPGCLESDLPGNRPIDEAYDKAYDKAADMWESGDSETRGEIIEAASGYVEVKDFPEDVIRGYQEYLIQNGQRVY